MSQRRKSEFTEVTIPVPWGKIAGKWWGPSDIRPILLIHGWLDNAGTFDTLIPLLPKDHFSYLAIDLPGHGLSSHIPEGMTYTHYDYVWTIYRIQNTYGWSKMSIIGHSLGGILAFLYAGLFPDRVDMIVTLDSLKPITDSEFLIDMLRGQIARLTTEITNHRSIKTQPAYTKQELVERMRASTYDSVSPEDCEYLFRRGIKESSTQPNKFALRSDARVKVIHLMSFSLDSCIDLVKQIKCPFLYIRADRQAKEAPEDSDREVRREEFMDKFRKTNKHFHYVVVDGKHHVHLSQPERVAGIVSDFILEYCGPSSKI
uniref:Putative conserved plasma membrane protein n=1 Tax=Lutzomyia longipalpis TaxID=7200 RepID=A0A1B0CAF7_LUTLO